MWENTDEDNSKYGHLSRSVPSLDFFWQHFLRLKLLRSSFLKHILRQYRVIISKIRQKSATIIIREYQSSQGKPF